MINDLLQMSEEEKEKLVSLAKRRIDSSSRYYYDYFEKWQKYYQIYRMIKDSAEDDDNPSSMIPLAYGIVEDIVARLAMPLVGKLPVIPKPKRKIHQKAADNFYKACKSIFSQAEYRLDSISSCRERVITGNTWEFDGWREDYIEGKIWKEQRQEQESDVPQSFMGKAIGSIKKMIGFDSKLEISHKFPEVVGYECRFPSVFNVFPEPGIKKDIQAEWIIEYEPEVSVRKLSSAMYDDGSGEKVSVYDLSGFQKDGIDMKKVRPVDATDKIIDIEEKLSENSSENSESDTPAVSLMRIHENNRCFVVANCKYLISCYSEIYHKPGIKARLKKYTDSKEELFGIGAIEPVENLIYENDDIHSLSMANWVRIINKMVIYDEASIPYPDDFRPRAGGKIRARLEGQRSVQDAFMSVDQNDVTGSMLAQESNNKGLIERAVSIADMSPGVEGTKQYHKTASGLLEISTQMAKRFTVMYTQDICSMQKQMDNIYWLFEQFMFDSMDFGGATGADQFVREDFDTGGLGFVFIQSDDPSFGDPAVNRSQNMQIFNLSMSYEQFRISSKDPSLEKAKLSNLLKKVYESFGYNDTTELIGQDYGVIAPDEEYNIMLQGGDVQVNPREDMVNHIMNHSARMMNPEFEMGVQAGRIPIEVKAKLIKHLDDTRAAMVQISRDPIAYTQQFIPEILAKNNVAPIQQPVPNRMMAYQGEPQ